MNARFQRSKRGLLTSAVLLALGASTGAALPASAQSPSDVLPAAYVGESTGSTAAEASSVTRDDAEIMLNPVSIAACNAGLGETSINSYEVADLGTVHLRCGDSSSGYVHIKAEHEGDWQKLMESFGGGGLWDDFMEFTVDSVLSNPSVAINQGSGKMCYSAPIVVVNSVNGTERTIYPSIVVSQNNLRVITAIPTTSAHNC